MTDRAISPNDIKEASDKAKEIMMRSGDKDHCFICNKESVAYLLKAEKYVCSECLDRLTNYCCVMERSE